MRRALSARGVAAIAATVAGVVLAMVYLYEVARGIALLLAIFAGGAAL